VSDPLLAEEIYPPFLLRNESVDDLFPAPVPLNVDDLLHSQLLRDALPSWSVS